MDPTTQEKYLIKLLEQQGEIKEGLRRIEDDVKEHMRRTANLEGRVEVLNEKDSQLEIKLTQHISRVNGAGILFGILCSAVALFATIAKLLNII